MPMDESRRRARKDSTPRGAETDPLDGAMQAEDAIPTYIRPQRRGSAQDHAGPVPGPNIAEDRLDPATRPTPPDKSPAAGLPTAGVPTTAAVTTPSAPAHEHPGGDGPPPTAAAEKPLSAIGAGFILLAEGYASLSAEVMALRMMVAYAGTGVVTTSILLAAYLTALGLGYTRGERVARRTIARGGRLRDKIAFRLAAAAAWTALWISDIGRTAAFEGAGAFTDPSMLTSVAVYSIGASFTGYLLAQTVCLVHYARQIPAQPGRKDAHGATAGARTRAPARVSPAWTVSTIGNVLGTLFTSMVILTLWGVAAALACIAGLLLLATLAARPKKLPAAAMTAAAILIAAVVVIDIESYVDRTAYADYIITHETPESDASLFVVNNSLASRDDPEGRGWSYIEWTEKDFCESGGGRILVLGAAGRTFGRGVGDDCRIEPLFIDIDGAQEGLSEEFLHGDPPGPLTVDDARRHLGGQSGWDAVFADAYNRTDQISEHLVTREFFTATRAALKDGGLLYVNIITQTDNENLRYETRVDRTIRSVYAQCRQNAAGPPENPWQNAVYKCRRTRIDGDAVIYSDMRVSAEIDTGLRLRTPDAPRRER